MLEFDDNYFMAEAYKEAKKAYLNDEVPVGAVLVHNQKIIARAHNHVEQLLDVTAHAEILCIGSGSHHLGSKYLNECAIYITLEPCAMCATALGWSQIAKIVFACRDVKKGFMSLAPQVIHPRTEIVIGVMQESCEKLIKDFFAGKRN